MKGIPYLICGFLCLFIGFYSLYVLNSVIGFVFALTMFAVEIVLFTSANSIEGATR